jgi:uncharacterized protein
MIVLLEEIGDAGLGVSWNLSAEFLADVLSGEGSATGFAPRLPSRLVARFDKVSGRVVLKASAQVGLTGSCKRCLREVSIALPVAFALNLVKEAGTRRSEGTGREGEPEVDEAGKASFDARAVDEERLDGRRIDLAKIAREQILLALPMNALCTDGCKGLCSACGKDLNAGECGCARAVVDPRWAGLKDLKLT